MRRWIARVCLCVTIACPVWAGQAQDNEAARANALFKAGKRPEALPLYEDLAKAHPNEMLYQERLADCLGAEAAQLSDPAQVKAVGRGSGMRPSGPSSWVIRPSMCRPWPISIPTSRSMPASRARARPCWQRRRRRIPREIFTTAMAKYIGRRGGRSASFTRLRSLRATQPTCKRTCRPRPSWFARAIAVDPNRETAYRYWGDAILKFGNDPAAAREKFIDAIVAEPYSKFAWQGITAMGAD